MKGEIFLKCLYSTKENLVKIDTISKEIKSTKSQISKLKNKKDYKPEHKSFFIFDIIFFILALVFLLYSIKELFLVLFTSRLLISFLLKFVLIFIAFIYIYCKRITLSKRTHKDDPIQNLLTKDDEVNLLNLENNLIHLENQLIIVNSNLLDCDLPSKYRNHKALDFFIEAFESKRADTLKELINLYEDYLFTQENRKIQEKQTKLIHKELKSINKEIRGARRDIRWK